MGHPRTLQKQNQTHTEAEWKVSHPHAQPCVWGTRGNFKNNCKVSVAARNMRDSG